MINDSLVGEEKFSQGLHRLEALDHIFTSYFWEKQW
jgi:hypothetical protein